MPKLYSNYFFDYETFFDFSVSIPSPNSRYPHINYKKLYHKREKIANFAA